MLQRLKAIDRRHWISLALVLASAALCLFVYRYPLVRIKEAAVDFGHSFAYFFRSIFVEPEELSAEGVTVNTYSGVDLLSVLGFDMATIVAKMQALGSQIFVAENLQLYMVYLTYLLTKLIYWLCWAEIVGVIVVYPIVLTWDTEDCDYAEDTTLLKWWKRCIVAPCRRVVAWLRDYFALFRASWLYRVFVTIWLLNFGLFAVLLEFFAVYFYVLGGLGVSFDSSTIGVQFVKALVDVLLCLHTLPWWVWAVIFTILFDRWRLAHAAAVVHHLERQNRGCQNELPMVTFLTGWMRTGKTKLMTIFSLEYSALFRGKALEKIDENYMKFPRFPWILFELDLQCCIKHHTVWNLATVRRWVRIKRARYEKAPEISGQLYGYDRLGYPMTYNDHLDVVSIWDVLEYYAQHFFIYMLESSMLIGNYSVRDDFIIWDQGNFPLIDTDYLTRDAREIDQISRYSHVIDYDAMRLGRKMMEDNPNIGGLEFGIIDISEIDKERKNTLKLQEKRVQADECNEKNDLFNEFVKMAGHAATVENVTYLAIIADAQRQSSWGADGSELSARVHLDAKGDACNAVPFFWVDGGLIDRFLGWYAGLHQNARFKWGKNHLPMWCLDGLASALFAYRLRRVNDFGYYAQKMTVESGSLDDAHAEEKQYFVLNKIGHSRRYATDCFKAFSDRQARECPHGIGDLRAYASIYSTLDDWSAQNSHFVADLFRYFDINKQ